MDSQSIQEKINSTFVDEIIKKNIFSETEISKIRSIIGENGNVDKMAEELFAIIGGSIIENS